MPRWQVFKVNRGLSSTARRHLRDKHTCKYQATRSAMGLPSLHSALETTSPDNEQPEQELFTMDGFLQRLVRWVVVDDQVGDDFVALDCLVFANSRLHRLVHSGSGVPRIPRSPYLYQ